MGRANDWLRGAEQLPPALREWRRTDTSRAPLTLRGIDWAHVKVLKALGPEILNLSPLRSDADVSAVLQEPQLVLRGDAAGIARATGVRTSESRLKAFAEKIFVYARAQQLLKAHGAQNLQGRLRTTTDGGGALQPPPGVAPAQPSGGAGGPGGPLPQDVARLPRAESEALVDVPARVPPPPRRTRQREAAGSSADAAQSAAAEDGSDTDCPSDGRGDSDSESEDAPLDEDTFPMGSKERQDELGRRRAKKYRRKQSAKGPEPSNPSVGSL